MAQRDEQTMAGVVLGADGSRCVGAMVRGGRALVGTTDSGVDYWGTDNRGGESQAERTLADAWGRIAPASVGEACDGHVLACVGYGLGKELEPAARAECSPGEARGVRGALNDRGWPDLVLRRLTGAHEVDAWGDWEARLPRESFRVGKLRSSMGEAGFQAGVARVLEYVRAGDVYQVNLAHRLSASFEGCPRALFAGLLGSGRPRHGAYLEFDCGDGLRRVVASASPELFLEVVPGAGRGAPVLRTMPMKGTGPATGGGASGRGALQSPKDRAELAMIVDLMRNDLGRVCELGSVRVEAAQSIETHGAGDAALLQATATIAGRSREGLSWSELLGATFPGGSVTGAPKVRAMQIIDELEAFERGAYCGSVGMLLPDGGASFNIAIRTACITGRLARAGSPHLVDATLDWWVGAGIVADSAPEDEWRETLAKASVLRSALGESWDL